MDQAHNLRTLMRDRDRQARVLAVTSGKGGVGKTNVSVNLAIALAGLGKRVVLFDADLGLANVEVLLGLNSFYNLEHVVGADKTIEEILVQGPGGIMVVPGSSGLAQVADLAPAQRDNLLRELRRLELQFDYVVMDTMAGIGANVVSFATAADEILLVTTPEPSSMVDAYAMLKTIHHARDDALIRLVANMVSTPAQGQAVATKLAGVAKQYLERPLSYLGCLPRDPAVSQAVMQSRPFLIQFPKSPASAAIQELASRLVRQPTHQTNRPRPGFFKRFAERMGIAGNG